ncbi:MAG: helix-turn-helix domain-containing protein [Myxococcota bacterium]
MATPGSSLDISDVAKRTRIPASTLRFYEEKKLISSIGRRGLHRLYAPNVVERLALINLGRAAGFSLDELATMLSAAADGGPRIDRRLLAAKADELELTIKRLTNVRDGLRHAAACRAASHMECPTFQRLLRAAAKGTLGGLEQAGRKPRKS